METAPFRTFSGFLKQFALEGRPALEQELFDLLFPAFRGTSAAEEAFEESIKDPRVSAVDPRIQIMRGERRPRRFAGFEFGRNRYFAVCADASGRDLQTLAHELRAYRDPVDLGMVEVVDLAQGCVLSIRGATVRLEPQPAFAVLVHEPQVLPERFHELPFQRVPGLKATPAFVYRFPYRVIHSTIERMIDLRFPEVQDWFYATFREPSEVSNARLVSLGPDVTPTTARSRFNFENALAPVPDSFWSMLPTLMNPDLGGGNVGDTGSTLLMIGHWMRQNGVGALVFPSARCDVAAVFEDGVLKHSQGWNLLDYRESPVGKSFGRRIDLVTFVVSPWAWVSLPNGARLHIARDPQLAGSFAVENVVNYWAQDYLDQLKALEAARALHGREKPRSQRSAPSEGLAFRIFQIGALSMRWLRMAVQGCPADRIDGVVLELQGLALPYGMYLITGRVIELWGDVRRGKTAVGEAVHAALTAAGLLCRHLQGHHPDEDLDKLARIGADLELLLFFLAGRVRAGDAVKAVPVGTAGFLAEAGAALETAWLDEALKTETRSFQTRALHKVEHGGSGTDSCLDEGVRLQKVIYDHLRRKGKDLW
jgi:hypothetical protein